LVHYGQVLHLLGNADYLARIPFDQIQAQVMLATEAFSDGWAIGFVFFGLHLILLGCLVFRSGFIPRILGILVGVAGLGYTVDTFGGFLWAGYDLSIGLYTGWGELLLMVWLIFMSGKLERGSDPGSEAPAG
jgi:hypothetical protein